MAEASAEPVAQPVMNAQEVLDDGRVVWRNVEYVEGGGVAQSLDLYLPSPADGAPPPPLIVYIHGGAWHSEDKSGHAHLAYWTTAPESLGSFFFFLVVVVVTICCRRARVCRSVDDNQKRSRCTFWGRI